jgi:hypothetical protein
VVEPLAYTQIGENEGPLPPHAFGVALHHLERGPDMRGEVDLVDDQEIGAGDAGAALGGNLVARGDVNDIDGEVGKLWRESCREVVTSE